MSKIDYEKFFNRCKCSLCRKRRKKNAELHHKFEMKKALLEQKGILPTKKVLAKPINSPSDSDSDSWGR